MYTVKKIENLIYDPRWPESCLVDIWLPTEKEEPVPVFLYFHGGGLVDGGRRDVYLMDMVTRHGIAVATADYRMYPNARFPDFLNDAASCAAFIRDWDGAAFSGIFLGGSSAGGYISMMLCFAPQYLAAVGMKPTDIVGYVHDAGQPTVHFNVLAERGVDSRCIRVDEAAPIYFIDHTPDPADVPPMLILYADNDMPDRPEQLQMLLGTMRYLQYPMHKIESKCMVNFSHCQYNSTQNEDGEYILAAEAAAFIKKYC